MSDHIAHLAICDDVFRLGRLHPAVHARLKRLMDEKTDIAHLGSITRQADKWSADLVDRARDDDSELSDAKLAFVAGALTHRAADRLTKPITNCWGKDADSGLGNANESKIYQDVFAFKEVFGSGRGPLAGPFSDDVLTQPTAEAEAAFERYFRVLWRRELIAMHTIRPDAAEHIDDWLAALLERLQTFPKRLSQYARIAAEWPADKVKQYLIDKHFYDRNDPIIRVARSIQHGSTARAEQVVEAVEATGQADSRYARALAKAIAYLLAAGELLDGRIDRAEAARRFDVGVPELSIQE